MPESKAANHLLVSLFYWAGGEGRMSWNPKFWEPLITSPQGFSSPLLRVQSFLECWATFDNKLWIHLPSKWSVFGCVCMLAKSVQSCPTLCDTMDSILPGSSVHGILWARIPEWVAVLFSRGSFWPRDRTWVSYISCIGRWVLYH